MRRYYGRLNQQKQTSGCYCYETKSKNEPKAPKRSLSPRTCSICGTPLNGLNQRICIGCKEFLLMQRKAENKAV